MKKALKPIFILIISSFVMFSIVSAETILLENEEVIQGRIKQYSNTSILVGTPKGEREIPLAEIHLIDYLGSAKDYLKETAKPNTYIIYLKNGEIIHGIINQFTNEIVTIESATGHGLLQLPTSSINFITSKKSRMVLNQRNAIGYIQKKSTLNSGGGSRTYNSDQLSLKFFFDKELFGNALLAYGNASYSGNDLSIFAVSYRMGMIFKKIQDINLYYGGFLGFMEIKDDSRGINGSGTTMGVFLGAEIFFASLPNFGFSGEIGYETQSAGSYSATDLSISSFPTFSIHYYF